MTFHASQKQTASWWHLQHNNSKNSSNNSTSPSTVDCSMLSSCAADEKTKTITFMTQMIHLWWFTWDIPLAWLQLLLSLYIVHTISLASFTWAQLLWRQKAATSMADQFKLMLPSFPFHPPRGRKGGKKAFPGLFCCWILHPVSSYQNFTLREEPLFALIISWPQ